MSDLTRLSLSELAADGRSKVGRMARAKLKSAGYA